MRTIHAPAVERDSTVTPEPDLTPKVRALLERITRSAYMCDMHAQGIEINRRRIAEAQRELDEIEERWRA